MSIIPSFPIFPSKTAGDPTSSTWITAIGRRACLRRGILASRTVFLEGFWVTAKPSYAADMASPTTASIPCRASSSQCSALVSHRPSICSHLCVMPTAPALVGAMRPLESDRVATPVLQVSAQVWTERYPLRHSLDRLPRPSCQGHHLAKY